MIQANELRIGNKVKQSYATLTVLEIGKTMVFCTDFNRTHPCTYEKINPIPLTPEILEKFGFKKIPDGSMPYWKLVLNRTEVISIEEDFSVGLNAADETSRQGYATSDNRCKYLHQLQNLYFALTGEELTVNL